MLPVFPSIAQVKKKSIVVDDTSDEKKGMFEYAPGDWATTISISSAFKSDFGLTFEKKVTEQISGEISLGGTGYDLMFDQGPFLNFRPENMPEGNGKSKAGISLRFGARWYPFSEKESLEGFYAGPQFSHRLYNTEGYIFNKYNTSDYTTHKLSSTQEEIRLMTGWQFVDEDGFFHFDLGLGCGYRFHSRKYLGYTDMQNPEERKMFFAKKSYFIYCTTVKVGFSLSSIFK
jgi:hypothetical protein